VDNLNDAYDIRLKNWRLTQLIATEGFSFQELDISESSFLVTGAEQLKLGKSQGLDGVINLAARAGVRYSTVDPWIYYSTNVIGTLNLLEFCRKYDVPKFVLASTSSVYGNGDVPFNEGQQTDFVLSPYAASKKAAEVLVSTYSGLYGLNTCILRYFTVYGPAGRPDMSVFRFIRAIYEGDAITLYGDGSQKRDFTYVDDIAKGTILALGPKGNGIINLGNDNPTSVNDLIAIVEHCLGKKAIIDNEASHPADVDETWAKIDAAKSQLGWTPKVGLSDGVAIAVEWYLANRDWANSIG
jgi:nucleoside-diphosphate-sugar epimerase